MADYVDSDRLGACDGSRAGESLTSEGEAEIHGTAGIENAQFARRVRSRSAGRARLFDIWNVEVHARCPLSQNRKAKDPGGGVGEEGTSLPLSTRRSSYFYA